MTVSLTRADDADKQRAFLALLADPLVTPWTDPTAYALVHRHAHTLAVWCRRLGYHLAHLDQGYRLRRIPVGGTVAVPCRAHPTRAELLLCLYAAACLDDHREETITLQGLSDVVRLSSAGRGGWPYDPDVRRHRTLFVAAVAWLVGNGVLEPRTDAALREGWQQTGVGIGGGYVIHRDALVLCLDTGDVDLALAGVPNSADDTTAAPEERGVRLLRLLVETQALLPAELSDPDRTYLSGQRTRLAGLAEEMTGGIVEVRADAIVLSLAPDRALPDALLIDFPTTSARDWACLALIDRITRAAIDGPHDAAGEEVRSFAAELHAEAGNRLTAELRRSPDAVLAAVEERLTELGLLRTGPDGRWSLTPLAGRYRAAQLRADEVALDAPAPIVTQSLFDLPEPS